MRHSFTRRQGPPSSWKAASLVATALLSGAALNAIAAPVDGVSIQRETADGTRGNTILVKPAPVGQTVTATATTKATGSADFLRGLHLDPSREAVPDATSASGTGMQLRDRSSSTDPASGKSTDPGDGASPVYVDGAGNPQALPGGVIVTFREPLDADRARAIIEATGHPALQEIGPRMWLVGTDSGNAALEAARSLAADSRFESAQPNWWRPPTRK